jgi:tRNA(fMet)-specific endonuclease VapC
MNGRFLLDTNIVIALFAGERRAVQKLRRAPAVFLPTVVVGELLYGALKSAQIRSNVERIEEFVVTNSVLSCDLETARYYGQIKHRLGRKGRPLPDNDLWIAAVAQQHGLTVVSRDKHFQEVNNLKVEVW